MYNILTSINGAVYVSFDVIVKNDVMFYFTFLKNTIIVLTKVMNANVQPKVQKRMTMK